MPQDALHVCHGEEDEPITFGDWALTLGQGSHLGVFRGILPYFIPGCVQCTFLSEILVTGALVHSEIQGAGKNCCMPSQFEFVNGPNVYGHYWPR